MKTRVRPTTLPTLPLLPVLPLLLLCPAGPAAADAPSSPPGGVPIETANPGFEGPYVPVPTSSDKPGKKAKITGSVAPGWSDNSDWADVGVTYSPDADNPHRGATAQKVAIDRVDSGAVQFVQKVPLKKGRVHVWKLWMRGRPGTAVALTMRRADAPYTQYAAGTANLSAEWQEFRVYGAVPEDAEGFLMVRATAPMTLWLDDSSLHDLTAAVSDAPPRAGNLLPGGGSFEAGGLPYGWSVRFEGEQGFRPKDPRPRVDAATAAAGGRSLRCDLPAGADARVTSPLVTPQFGRDHTLSFWAKARVPGTRLRAEIEQASSAEVTLGTGWKRYTLSARMPFVLYTRLRLLAQQAGEAGNTVWLDGVQFEERADASPNYLAPEPVELSLRLPQPGHVLLGTEPGAVRVALAGVLPAGARLRTQVSGLDGRPVPGAPPAAVPLPADSLRLPAMGNRYGLWKLRAWVADAKGKPVSAPYEMVWARLPRPKEVAPERSYFGAHLPLSQSYFDLARRIGVRRTRLHDVSMISKWSVVEPEPGRFRFFDEGVDAARRSGIAVLGMLDGAPGWASTRPREGYWGIWHIPDAPGAADRWEEYVRRIVGHYRGRIDQWEVWNEPWGNWWAASGNPNATPALYGELSRRAYAAARAANPRASVLGIDTYPGHDWTGQVLPHASPAHFDGFSFHEYNDAPFGGPDAIPFRRRREFLSAQAKHGTPKPLWNTEGGLFGVGSLLAPETGGMAAAQQPGYIVRFDVTQMAAGVRAFFLYALHTDPALGATETAATEYDRSVKPLLAARAVLASLVDGLGTPVRSEPAEGVDLYTYPGGRVAVSWSYDGRTHAVRVPRGTRPLDVWGNPLPAASFARGTVTVGDDPVYFVR